MHHLGEAHRQFSGATKEASEAHLHTAIGSFQAALRARTEAGFPRDWAETQRPLALTCQTLAEATGKPDYAVKAEEHRAAARRVRPAV